MIKIINLFKSFDAKQVLRNINIQFETGKVYGIVGENGDGKTTLFRCIAGIEKYAGQIDSEHRPLKNYLGFLPTEPFFFSKITGEEYIRLLCNARKREFSNIKEKNIFDLPLSKYSSTYSTGMKKKLALMSILLQENQYFILDEPFNGIDIYGNLMIVDIISKLKELGKIVIISSHVFSTLRDTCDEIFLLSNGVISMKAIRENFASIEFEMKKLSTGSSVEKLEIK